MASPGSAPSSPLGAQSRSTAPTRRMSTPASPAVASASRFLPPHSMAPTRSSRSARSWSESPLATCRCSSIRGLGPGTRLQTPTLSEPLWWRALTDYVTQMQSAWLTITALGRRHHPELTILFAMLAGCAPLQYERLGARGGPARPPRSAHVLRHVELRAGRRRHDQRTRRPRAARLRLGPAGASSLARPASNR